MGQIFDLLSRLTQLLERSDEWPNENYKVDKVQIIHRESLNDAVFHLVPRLTEIDPTV